MRCRDSPVGATPDLGRSTITHLDEKARIEELASMLRGEAREATTLKEAAAMLAAAKKKW